MLESFRKVVRKLPESFQKVSRKLPEFCQKVARKFPESCQTVMRQSWDSHETVMRQSRDRHETAYYFTSAAAFADMFVLVCSMNGSVSEWPSNRVATRPWLAFQANAMVKTRRGRPCCWQTLNRLAPLLCIFFFSPTWPQWAELVIESPCPSVCLSVCLCHRKTPTSGGRVDLWSKIAFLILVWDDTIFKKGGV